MASDRTQDGSTDSELRRLLHAPPVSPQEFLQQTAGTRLQPGTLLGDAFAIKRVLGAGGMGVVYLARHEALRRDVAIKLCARRATAAETDRLLREARATAALNHPNVVVVHHVGEFAEQVFVVMEYVDGGTLAEWLRDGPHSHDEIAEKFVDAARGLAAAHEAGLIHRDFKPENVFIGRDGRARVGDFGLARGEPRDPEASPAGATQGDHDSAATARAGTLRYMAPEQHAGAEITAAADQFAFCVSLFEACSGEHPFSGATTEAIATAVVAERRRDDVAMDAPARMRRAVERGLSGRPEERHASMAALIGALLRPRRTAPLLVGGAAVATALVALLARATAAETCDGARVPPPSWSDADRTALREAIGGAPLLQGPRLAERFESAVDDYTERWHAAEQHVCRTAEEGDSSIAARHACLRGAAVELESTLAVLADADVGKLGRALELVHRLPDVQRCSAPAPPERRGATRPAPPEASAAFARSQVAFRVGAFDETTKHAMAVIDGDADERTRAQAQLMLARVTNERRDFAKFHEQAEEVLTVAIEIGADDIAGEVASMLTHVHGARESDLPAALRWAGRAKAWHARIGDPTGPRLRLAVHTGLAYTRAGRPDEAVAQMANALALARELDPPNAATEAQALLNYGVVLNGAGRYDDAEAVVREGMAIAEDEFGRDHPLRTKGLNTLVASFHSTDRNAEAVPLAAEVLERWERLLGPDSPRVASAHNNLALTLMRTGKAAEALAHAGQALAIFEKHGNNEQLREFLGNIASMELSAGKLDAALGHAQRSVVLAEDVENPLVRIEALARVADIRVRRGEAEQALAVARQAIALGDEAYPPGDPNRASARVVAASAAQDLGDPALALAMFSEARGMLAAAQGGTEHSDAPYAHAGYAQALVDVGRPKDALPLLEAQLEQLADDHETVLHNFITLARARAATGDRAGAVAALAKAAEAAETPELFRQFVAPHPELTGLE